jgi:transcription-repair coupling factor (superfamily II helicase)
MKDLDIRGAGNILGAEQSGFIADIGYETYQKILEEAVQELLGLLAQIKSDKEASIAHFDEKIRVTKENLRKCGHELKEAAPSSKVKTVKLKDEQIKSGLQRILSGKKDGMSIPAIMKELQIMVINLI